MSGPNSEFLVAHTQRSLVRRKEEGMRKETFFKKEINVRNIMMENRAMKIVECTRAVTGGGWDDESQDRERPESRQRVTESQD